VRQKITEGRQAYVVYPLVEESEKIDVRDATAMADHLSQNVFPEFAVGLLHGRLAPDAKQRVMDAFTSGALRLLVATTVVEVGVDVPNATVIVVEHAERFGLSQLHQLRGRVGRGTDPGHCVLLYQSPLSQMAKQRLETMRETNDGFVIAEKDLQLRGPGEPLGTRQTGLAAFRVADLARDAALLPRVRTLADQLLADDPALADRIIDRWVGGAARYASA
jgi:ATP-dependent DNA helicase RecG